MDNHCTPECFPYTSMLGMIYVSLAERHGIGGDRQDVLRREYERLAEYGWKPDRVVWGPKSLLRASTYWYMRET